MKLEHVVICTGGQLGKWAIPFIQEAQYIIGADRGALFLIENGFPPHLAIGDFDSVSQEMMLKIQAESHSFKGFDAINKDYTDTELAFHHALALKPILITILGGTGTRLDHTIGNIQLLSLSLNEQITARLIDEHNIIQLINKNTVITKLQFPYISLLPYSDIVKGITLEGFKYPLQNATIKKGQSIGVSNELIGKQGAITLTEGQLLVIHSID